MIVHNYGRSFFAHKADAEKARVAAGGKPGSTLTIEINGRDDLAALLNALCEAKPVEMIAPPALVDRAYVPVENSVPDCIPDFLLRSHGLDPAKLERVPS